MVIGLLNCRPAEATICPSEVARAVSEHSGRTAASESWREEMPIIHHVIDDMIAEGLVRLSWKGVPLTTRSGPYRISRVSA